MTLRVAMLAVGCVALSGFAIAQTQTPPADTTTPSTSQPAPKEAPATERNASRPASASTPHQRQATGKERHPQLKDCIAKERAADSSLSEEEARTNCKDQVNSEAQSSQR